MTDKSCLHCYSPQLKSKRWNFYQKRAGEWSMQNVCLVTTPSFNEGSLDTRDKCCTCIAHVHIGGALKTKLTRFPRKHTLLKCFVIYLDFPLNNHVAKTNKQRWHNFFIHNRQSDGSNRQADVSMCWRSRHFQCSHALIMCCCIQLAGNNCAIVSRSGYIWFDQRHVTKNQPITVLVLLSESLGI